MVALFTISLKSIATRFFLHPQPKKAATSKKSTTLNPSIKLKPNGTGFTAPKTAQLNQCHAISLFEITEPGTAYL
jgi:hypothetical protein